MQSLKIFFQCYAIDFFIPYTILKKTLKAPYLVGWLILIFLVIPIVHAKIISCLARSIQAACVYIRFNYSSPNSHSSS